MKKRKYTIVTVVSLIVFLGVWELLTDILHVKPDYILPSPIQVVKALVAKFYETKPDGSILFTHIGTSLKVALSGYCLAVLVGIPMGIAMAWSKRIDQFIKPLFDFIRSIPPIGWIPIMILLFGIGTGAKAAVIFLSTFIPCVLNAYTGIKSTKQVHIWVAETFGASSRQVLFKVAIPSALPQIFTGLKVALSTAWMTLVGAELLAATSGLGYMIQIARMLGRPDIIIAGMLTIGAIGAIFAFVLDKIEKKFVKGRF